MHEELSIVHKPDASVTVQTMRGPLYKTYRILDIREDGALIAMSETGNVKHGIPVLEQGELLQRINDAFVEGKGAVRALVVGEGHGHRELCVDYKVINGSRL